MIDTRVKVPDYATDVRDWNELSSRADQPSCKVQTPSV